MDMKKVIAIGALAASFLAWRMGAMQRGQNQNELMLRPKNGPVVRMPVNTACVSGTIKMLYDDLKGEDGTLTEPISLTYISTDDLHAMLVTEASYILGVHAAYNNGVAPPARLISELPEDVRKERAQRAAHAMAQTAYDLALLKRTMDRFQAAEYLDIPELYERYARMIADMLICDAGLAALSRNAVILNEFTFAAEEIVAHYIPELWFEVCTLRGHTAGVYSAVFSPDGTRVLTASGADGTVRIWNAATGRLVWTFVGDNHGNAAIASDGIRVVTPSEDNTANIWNATNGALVAWLVGHTGTVYSAEFSPDGRRVVTASSDRTAKIWNAATGRLEHTLAGHTGRVSRASFSPDGSKIVTASWDQTAKIWNAATGGELRTLIGHTNAVYSASFSPDGTRVVTASWDNTAKIWNASTGALLMTLVGHLDWPYSAEFSPDGTRVVTASSDGTAKIWNAETGAKILDLVGHTQSLRSASFSPDGTRVVTASVDKTAKIWQLLPTSLPGVNDFDAVLFTRLLYWAHTHNRRVTDQAWAPRVRGAIEWNSANPVGRIMLPGWIRAAGIR